MSIIMSVSLLFMGLVLLVLFHVFISGVISRRNIRESMVERGANNGSITMSIVDLEKIPSYNYISKDITSSPVDCAVCLETLITGDKCRLLPICKHSFHAQCVDKWLLKTPFCPICRSSAGSSQNGGRSQVVIGNNNNSNNNDNSVEQRNQYGESESTTRLESGSSRNVGIESGENLTLGQEIDH